MIKLKIELQSMDELDEHLKMLMKYNLIYNFVDFLSFKLRLNEAEYIRGDGG